MRKPNQCDIRGAFICIAIFFLFAYYYQFHYRVTGPVVLIKEALDISVPEEAVKIIAQHKISKSIDNLFFIETSCALNERISADANRTILKERQACAIYSTAYHNPRKHVFLIVTCPLHVNFYEESPDFMKVVLDLPNFSIAHVDVTDIYLHSHLFGFLDGSLLKSEYPVEHNADILRILLVYLYGGTYVDLDFVCTRSLQELGTNYIGAESMDAVATGIFNFEARHPFLEKCLSVARPSYDPSAWNSVGPLLATAVLKEFCNLTTSANFNKLGHISQCGITVWKDKVFYPIRHTEWQRYWDATAWPQVQLILNNTYAVHVWNHKSAGTPITVGSQQPYGKLAEQHCAPVYRHSGLFF